MFLIYFVSVYCLFDLPLCSTVVLIYFPQYLHMPQNECILAVFKSLALISFSCSVSNFPLVSKLPFVRGVQDKGPLNVCVCVCVCVCACVRACMCVLVIIDVQFKMLRSVLVVTNPMLLVLHLVSVLT